MVTAASPAVLPHGLEAKVALHPGARGRATGANCSLAPLGQFQRNSLEFS